MKVFQCPIAGSLHEKYNHEKCLHPSKDTSIACKDCRKYDVMLIDKLPFLCNKLEEMKKYSPKEAESYERKKVVKAFHFLIQAIQDGRIVNIHPLIQSKIISALNVNNVTDACEAVNINPELEEEKTLKTSSAIVKLFSKETPSEIMEALSMIYELKLSIFDKDRIVLKAILTANKNEIKPPNKDFIIQIKNIMSTNNIELAFLGRKILFEDDLTLAECKVAIFILLCSDFNDDYEKGLQYILKKNWTLQHEEFYTVLVKKFIKQRLLNEEERVTLMKHLITNTRYDNISTNDLSILEKKNYYN